MEVLNKSFAFLAVIFVLIGGLFSFSGCATQGFEGKAVCTGRVCGPDGTAVPGYHISFGLGLDAVTGINGVFMIPEMEAGEYVLKGGGKGWSSISEKVVFSDKKSIVTVQVAPLNEVYQDVEKLIRSYSYDSAENLLAMQKKYNEEDDVFDFYCSLVEFCKNQSEHEKRNMRKILEMN